MNRSHPSKTQEKSRPVVRRRAMKFPQVKGKTLDEVEFSTGQTDHSVTLRFRDKTALRFSIDPGFSMFFDYADSKSGEAELIREWKPMRSWLFREP